MREIGYSQPHSSHQSHQSDSVSQPSTQAQARLGHVLAPLPRSPHYFAERNSFRSQRMPPENHGGFPHAAKPQSRGLVDHLRSMPHEPRPQPETRDERFYSVETNVSTRALDRERVFFASSLLGAGWRRCKVSK